MAKKLSDVEVAKLRGQVNWKPEWTEQERKGGRPRTRDAVPNPAIPRNDPQCSVIEDGTRCTGDSKTGSRGWCGKHYTRWQRHGSPLIVKVRVRGSFIPVWRRK